MPTIDEMINELTNKSNGSDVDTTNNLVSNQMTSNINSKNVSGKGEAAIVKDTYVPNGIDALISGFDKETETSVQTRNAFTPYKSKQKKWSFSSAFTDVDTSGPNTFVEKANKINNEPFKAKDNLEIFEYNNLKPDKITKEILLKDTDFLADARTQLQARHSKSDEELNTNDKIWEAWVERQRYFDMGHEATIAFDLDHLKGSDDKWITNDRTHRYGRLLDVWEKYKGEDTSWRKLQDYAGAAVTSPSNVIAFAASTFGGAKAVKALAALVTQGGKVAVKAYLKTFMINAAKVAPFEFGVGFAQSSGKETLRSESMMEAYRNDIVGFETAVQGFGGSVFGGFGGVYNTRSVSKSLDLQKAFSLSKRNIAAIAKRNTDDFLKTLKTKTDKELLKNTKARLAALSPELTAMGKEFRKNVSSDPNNFIAGLPIEFHNNLVAAAVKLSKIIKPREGERITSTIHRAITEGVEQVYPKGHKLAGQPNGQMKMLSTEKIRKILKDHNLNTDQFGLIFLSDVSDAGKTLRSMRTIKDSLNPPINPLKDVLKDLDTSGITSGLSEDVIENVWLQNVKGTNFVRNFWSKLDRFKLGSMTSQPQTTMRNNMNSIFRIGTDTLYYAFNQGMQGKNPINSKTFSMWKYMINSGDAKVFREIFKEEFPEESASLFREAADLAILSSNDGVITKYTTGKLAYLGTKLNVLNTLSDNYFKQGALLTFMRRGFDNLPYDKLPEMTLVDKKILLAQKIKNKYPDIDAATAFVETLSPKGLKEAFSINKIAVFNKKANEYQHDLFSLIKVGKLNEVPEEVRKQAIQDTYEFVYQANFKSDGYLNWMNKGVQRGHRNLPFVISSLFPFPRYTANHLKTVYNHLPLINLLKIENIGSDKLTKEGVGSFARLLKTDPTTFKKDMARGMVGTGLFLASLEWRYRQGNTNAWWEIKSKNGKSIDGRAIYGAVAPYMLAADIMYRYQTNTLPTSKDGWNEYGKQAAQALIGVTIRRGMGLIFLDKLVNSFDENNQSLGRNPIEEFISNTAQAFMIPTQIVNNFLGFNSQQARRVPETKDGNTNVLDIILSNGLRGAPDLEKVDIKSGISSEYTFPSLTTDYKTLFYKSGTGEITINKMFTDVPVYDRQTVDVIEGPIKNQSPMYKLAGFTQRPAKNLFKKELSTLNIPTRSLYKRDYGNNEIELTARDLLGKDGSPFNLALKMARYIKGDPYQNVIKNALKVNQERGKNKTFLGLDVNDAKTLTAKSPLKFIFGENYGGNAPVQIAPSQRTQLLVKQARGYIADARAYAMAQVSKLDVLAGQPYTVETLKNWKSVSATNNSATNEFYRQTNEFVYAPDKKLVEPSNVYLDRNYFIIKGPLTKTSWANRKNVLVQYTEYAKSLGKKEFGQ